MGAQGAAGTAVQVRRWGPIAGLALAAALALALIARPQAAPEFSLPFLGGGKTVAAERAYGKLPLAFERGAGRVDFVARSQSGDVTLTDAGARLALGEGGDAMALTFELAGARDADPEGLARLPGEANYLVGEDRSQWRTGVRTFERVRYPHVYPGISLDWFGNQRRLEYDFRLAAGADPSRIAIDVRGGDTRLAANGDLVIEAQGAAVRQRAPVAFQTIGGAQMPVDATFTLTGRTVGFDLGPYDRSRPLVIDPLILSYSTYLGGDGDDTGAAIAVDSTGAAYVTGATTSTDFDTAGPIEGDSTDSDVFVSKVNPDGSALVYSTYLGGNSIEGGRGIAVDATGAAYVTGNTFSSDFNLAGEYEANQSGMDVFLSKLTPQGDALAYSSYLGGTGTDEGHAVAVDAGGGAYVTGHTAADDFDTVGQYEANQPMNDAFFSKFDTTQTGAASLPYSTYLGGNASEDGEGIAVDAAGAAYVTGQTGSTDFDTVGAYEADPGDGASDAFVSKFDPSQTGAASLLYSTYLGGDDFDQAHGIAVDSAGASYVAGQTDSTDFDTVGAIEGDSADTDAFISKLTPAGNALAYSTYLGGDSFDFGRGVAVDSAGAASVTGFTASTDFNSVEPLEGDSPGDDVFVSKLIPSGAALAFSTYLGGAGAEFGQGIAVDSQGTAYVAGYTDSSDFDTLAIEGDSTAIDVFVSKLGEPVPLAVDTDPPETTITKGPKKKTEKRKAKFKYTADEPATFECKLDKKGFAPCGTKFKKKVKPKKHKFQVRATDAAGNTDPTPAKRKWKVLED